MNEANNFIQIHSYSKFSEIYHTDKFPNFTITPRMLYCWSVTDFLNLIYQLHAKKHRHHNQQLKNLLPNALRHESSTDILMRFDISAEINLEMNTGQTIPSCMVCSFVSIIKSFKLVVSIFFLFCFFKFNFTFPPFF